MFLTGFADEASIDFKKQIEVTKRLGWSHIEARCINGKNLASLSDEEFEEVEQQLAESGISINCFGSGVANGGRDPRKEADFEASCKELTDAIPRMQKLGIKMVRGMSFALAQGEQFDSPELEAIIFRKVKTLVSICEDNGIIYGHENCSTYGGQSFKHTLKLLEAINSPAFTLIFDTGNPVFTFRRIGNPPYPIQSSWEFYRKVKPFISYLHIKDGCTEINEEAGGLKNMKCTFPGEGCGDVRAIVTDLIRTGYDGGFSMEPHIGMFYQSAAYGLKENDFIKQRKIDVYYEYGRRFEQLYKECKANVEAEKAEAALWAKPV